MSTTSDKFVRDMLLKGRSVDFVADASGYPHEHVARVLQEIRDSRNGDSEKSESEADSSGTNPGQFRDTVTDSDVSKPSQLGTQASTPGTERDQELETRNKFPETDKPSLPEMREQVREVQRPRPEFNARTTNAVELLSRAADMDDRRVQGALGRARKAMTDLAAQVNRYDEQNGARERLAELEAEIAAIKAQLRGGSKPKQARKELSAEQIAKMQEANKNDEPCVHGCGFVAKNKAGKSAHERSCSGQAVAV